MRDNDVPSQTGNVDSDAKGMASQDDNPAAAASRRSVPGMRVDPAPSSAPKHREKENRDLQYMYNPLCDLLTYIEDPWQLPDEWRQTRIDAAVARSISKAEACSNKDAKAALRAEWDRLRKIGTWNEKGVREYDEVVAENKTAGRTCHFG